jgi:tetratricopeptide (TPR) repeat protein
MRSLTLCLLIATLLPATAFGQDAAARKELSQTEFRDWYDFNRAGWLWVERNNLKNAEVMFKRAIETARLEFETDPRLLARSYADLAWVLHAQGRDAEAEPLAKWALTVREQTLGAESLAVGQTVYSLGLIESALGRLDEAEAMLTRSLTTFDKVLGPSHLNTADVLDDLAAVLVRRRKYDRARPLYSRALLILGNHPARSNPLAGLAAIEVEEGTLAEAERHLDQALEVLARGGTGDETFHAGVLARKADVLRKTGRAAEADAAEARSKALAAASRSARRPTANAARPGWLGPARRPSGGS